MGVEQLGPQVDQAPGTEDGATLDPQDGDLTPYDTGDRARTHHTDTYVETTDVEEKAEETELFYDAVAAGEEPEMNSIEEALTVQRVLDTVYRSNERGGETVQVGDCS